MKNNIEYLEANKIIAPFMGWYRDLSVNKGSEINWFHDTYSTQLTKNVKIPVSPRYFKYHSSMDWIVPVLKKIEQTDAFFGIFTGEKEIYWCKIVHFDTLENSDKEISCQNTNLLYAIYEAIIEFINWYNENKNKNE